jgi:hypothetical protein
VDGLLPAASLPAGPSEVVWRYRPVAFRLGLILSASAAVAGVCLLFLSRRFSKVADTRNRQVGTQENQQDGADFTADQ